MSIDIENLKRTASQVRRDIIRQVAAVNSGHPGGSLGCADLFTALYFHIMDHDPSFNMKGDNEDMFFLSNGHISPVWYSVLARSGYFPIQELATFRKINSRLQGHPATHEGLPGIRVASGSLGQGISVAIGAALTKRLNKDDKHIFVLTGDGELQEGQIWESLMFAAHHKVDNLIAIVDYNGQQIDGPNEEVISLGNLHDKWSSFGWDVLEMDGHDFEDIINTITKAKENKGTGKPVVILMKTDMGKGVDFMEGTHKWHGKAPNAEQTESALSQLEETLGDY
ncbi:MAG: transketolase [Saprospiraceae bacterium]|nr:transketolase [Bacteroidia bacterium]NNE15620.1 transketolase [Saprospiraceae bacterium]NNL91385.1 transketolase [Saprospiraceae bacterium]